MGSKKDEVCRGSSHPSPEWMFISDVLLVIFVRDFL